MINSLKKLRKWYLLSKNEKYCTISVLLSLTFWLLLTRLTSFSFWTSIVKEERFLSKRTYSIALSLKSIQRCYRLFPHSNSCLIQALVLWSLIDRDDDLHIIIGVQKSKTNHFEAHAWIEKQSEILIGKRTFDAFVPIWRYSKNKIYEN